MKIVDVRAVPIKLPMRPFKPEPVGGETSASHTLILVDTDEGIQGIGETFRLGAPAMCAFVDKVLGPLLIGEDPRRIEHLWERMYAVTYRFGRAGLALHAISGIEIALWDIKGKAAGLPVHELLGGPTRDSIPAYASLHKFARPEEAAEMAGTFAAAGYRAVKLHQNDVASVAKARLAVGDEVALMLDPAGAWTVRDALDICHRLAEHRLDWVEEPLARMDDYDGLAWLRDRSPVRIAAGENEYTHWGYKELVARHAVDLVQPDLIKSGGMIACRRIAALADSFNLEISPHSFYYGPGIAATVQFCAATPRTRYIETNPHDLEAWFMDPPLRPTNGMIAVPTGPGLGIKLDMEMVEAHRVEL